jgi:hypothetical protein
VTREQATVVVTHDARRWTLAAGELATFGRSDTCTIRIGVADEYVSRHAGTLEVLHDCVLVRNESRTRPFAVTPATGARRLVEPGEAVTSLPHDRFSVVLTGRFGDRYELRVDASEITPAERPPLAEPTRLARPTVTPGDITLTPARLRLLAALCEPLLRGADDDAGPATYRAVADRTGLRPGYVANVFHDLRRQLSDAGMPGLMGREPDADFRGRLADWALRTGKVTREHLRLLDDEGRDGARRSEGG